MKLNFYDKLYYIFYTLSGKKNNPEITAFLLLSFAIFLLCIVTLFFMFFYLETKNIFNYMEYMSGEKKDYFIYLVMGGAFIILIFNAFLFLKRGPIIIDEIENNENLNFALKKKRFYIGVYLLFIVFAIYLIPKIAHW